MFVLATATFLGRHKHFSKSDWLDPFGCVGIPNGYSVSKRFSYMDVTGQADLRNDGVH